MDNVDRKTLLKELEFLTDLLEKHEASKKEEKSATQQKCRKLPPQKLNQPAHHSYKLVKNPTQLQMSHDKYSLTKNNNLSIINQRTVLNKNFNATFGLSKNQTSKYISSARTNENKTTLNGDNLSAPKRTVLCSEKKVDKTSTASFDKSDKMQSHTKFIEELESLTELLKKRNSTNKHLNSTAKNESSVQNKLSVCTSKKDDFKYATIFSKPKCQIDFPQKVVDSNSSSFPNSKKLSKISYSKINSNVKSGHSTNFPPLKNFNRNKYSYRKSNSNPLTSKNNTIPLSIESKKITQTQLTRTILGSHVRKVTYSNSKICQLSSCLSSNVSVFKSSSSDKQNLTIKSNSSNGAVSSKTVSCKKSPSIVGVKSRFSKVKTPHMPKSSKASKLKPDSTNYIKMNKGVITPSKNVPKSPFSTKKVKRKLNSKYKVINKSLAFCPNEKLNSLSSSVASQNSPLAIDESESFFQKLNDSTIDKLEQDLLAISTALTSTPLSNETIVNKVPQHAQAKVNLTLTPKKIPLKRSKTRISKYKIVNSSPRCNYSLKKQNLSNLKTVKNISYSKLSLVNKHLEPMHMISPFKQGKSVLVKRLFKSKNTIINKNTSPTSFSAKMIKSKYFSLNKRKLSAWQNHTMYTKVPSHHQKIKGYSSRAKVPGLLNRYKTAATIAYHPKVPRKFLRYRYSALNGQFSKSANGNKYKRKLKNGFVHSPVVFIRGMRYSLNSSGKTLKKLPAKGQTVKSHRRVVVRGRTFIKAPEIFTKVSPTTSNIASRVLNRSINRIISASSKKSLTKVNSYCMFYNRFGRCNKGIKCTYIHDPSKIAVCTRFLRGTCKIEGCPFSHEVTPGKMALCSFFLVGACEKKNCPYRHEKLLPNAELCKAFVQGYCPHGKECKKAHILICPKYIQGDCDKGNSCAYPHPPKKMKKNVQKEEESEEKKPDDVLLDQVSRYFLQTEECLPDENKLDNAANQFVPKQRRRLEEQPSFIPLCEF